MSFIYTDNEMEEMSISLKSCVSLIEKHLNNIWDYSFPKVKDALAVLFRYNLTPVLQPFSSQMHED